MDLFGGQLPAFDVELALRILLAFVLGAVPGWEREAVHRPAGLRTYMLVSGGAAAFTVVSVYGFPGVDPGSRDPSRIAAQVVTGVGFLGAGTIFRTGTAVRGLTTAAGLWLVAAIGMLVGSGMYLLAVFTAILAWFTLALLRYVPVRGPRSAEDKDGEREPE